MTAGESHPQQRNTFVGREQELQHLRAAYDACARGQGSFVMVVGEPGIGKTALCERLAEYVREQGGRALFGYCYEEGFSSLPYLPFVVALRDYLVDHDAESVLSQLGSDAPYLGRIVREVRERVVETQPAGDPEEDRWRLLEAITHFLGAIAAEAPLLLVLEDLHWADRGTLDALRHLARSVGGMRMLVVGTYRDVEVDRTHPLSSALAELRRSGSTQGFRRIALRGLSVEEVHRLYEATRGNDVPRAQAELVHNQTEGNPLFVREVLRYLVEEGYVVRQGNAYVYASRLAPESVVPEGLRDVVGKRFNHLSEACNRLLSIAAVIGREFDLDTLLKVAALGGSVLDEDATFEAVEEAVRSGVLEETVRPGAVQYRFTHAFFRQTLYDELSAARRLRTHQLIARVLEDRYAGRLEDHANELAEHLTNSTDPVDLAKAIRFSVLAAEQATEVFAYGVAARLLERTIEIQDIVDREDKVQRYELLMLLGEALIKGGEATRVFNDVARRALEMAEALGDSDRASRACQQAINGLRASRGFGGWGTPEVATWAESAARYATDNTLGRVWADGALGRLKVAAGQEPEGLRLVGRALSLARELDDDTAIWVAGAFWLETHMAPQFVSESVVIASELLEHGGQNVSPLVQRPAIAMMQHPFWQAGDRAKAEAVLNLSVTLAERSHQPNLELHVQGHAAFSALLAGQLEEVIQTSEVMLARAEELGLADFLIGGGFLGPWQTALIHLGRPEGHQAIPMMGDPPLALVHAVCGRTEQAAELIERIVSRRGKVPAPSDLTPTWNDLPLLQAALRIGHHDAVHFVLRRYVGHGVPGIVRVWGVSVPRLLGDAALYLDDSAAARLHYETAIEVCRRMAFLPELALAELGLAEVLLKHHPGEREEALRVLELAIGELEGVGMQPALQRALALKDAGPRLPQAPDYPDGLSGREVEVLRLVAAGKSNQQIADELVISMNTVIRHVSNIFSKIGAANRTEAASYAHRHSLT
jgi:DNA-binding CsgD family transcriptional regulator